MTGPRVAKFVANAINQRGQLIILRAIQPSAQGPIPAILAAPAVAADTVLQATSVSLNCSSATGFLVPGDRLTLGGQKVVVTAKTAARPLVAGGTAGFDNVPVAPPLNVVTTADSPVTVSFAADKPLKAMVISFPMHLVDGSNTLVSDLMVTIGAFNQRRPDPATQKLIVGGDVCTIVKADPAYGPGGEIAKWIVQAR